MVSLEHLELLSWLVITLSVVICIYFYKTTFPYGRYSRKVFVNYSLRPKIAWIVIVSSSFVVTLLLFLFNLWNGDFNLTSNVPNLILLFCFSLHYFHRSFIWGAKINSTKEVPLELFLFSFSVCSINGFLQSQYLMSVHFHHDWIYQSNFLIGLLIFFVGMSINIHSDYILINLRSFDRSYKVPRGGFFEYVSGANYFGEIVEWSGFALASLSLPSLAFLILTICFVGPRAKQHHEWYKGHFDDYPKDRKCLIPFVW